METVILKTFDNYFTANIILTRLQNAGINCYLKDEYTVTIDPILSNAIGGIKLAVDVYDAQQAQLLLNEFEEDYRKAAVCPKCNRNEINLVPKPGVENIVTSILTWLFSSYAVAGETIYQCGHCGYESKTLPENVSDYN
ncbi:MAG: hypothetical protein JWQ27_1577 [Ferruginibacter sp.]|nr:hypothetical protein [Ferruginibacter sp.]